MHAVTSAAVLDTYSYVKRLVDAGVPEGQAEIQMEAVVTIIDGRIATKLDLELLQRDMKEIEANLKRDMKEMDTKLVARISEVEANLKRDMKEMDTRLVARISEVEANLKRDIKEMDTKLEARINGVEANLKREMKEMDLVLRGEIEKLQLKLTIRLGAILAAGLAILATLEKLL